MKGILFIFLGLFIDGLQAMVTFVCFTLGSAAEAVTPVGGGAAGAAIGAYTCYNSAGGIIAGVTAAAKCTFAGGVLGAALSAAGVPLGIALGFALNVCISLTIGTAFILLLSLNGMFSPGYMWSAFIGEAIPGLDNLPGWTTLAILCAIKKASKEGRGISRIAATAASAIMSPASATGLVGGAIAGVSALKQEVATGARQSPLVQKVYETKPVQEIAQTRQDLRATVGQELRSIPRPLTQS